MSTEAARIPEPGGRGGELVELDPGLGRRPEPLTLVIFGASGDLANRKILPALAALAARGSLPKEFSLIGIARTELSDEAFREACRHAAPDHDEERWLGLLPNFRYLAGDYGDQTTFSRLAELLDELDRSQGTSGNRVYYLATIPSLFATVAAGLAAVNLNVPGEGGSFSRLVVEKPFGADLVKSS